jgi:predicted nucleotidyltransferase
MSTDTTKPSNELKDRISESLKPLHPEKVILFGSYAWGQVTKDSDIDLIVVLNKEETPRTYRDKMVNRLLVRRALDELNRDYALDLLVYTSSEWRDFQKLGSAFSMEIASRGIEV